MSNLNLILLVVAAVFGVLYMLRRKARLQQRRLERTFPSHPEILT